MFAKVLISLALVSASLAFDDVNVDPVLCTEPCPLYYDPVCGTDGRYYQEFSNECELRMHNCQVQRSLMTPYAPVHLDMCRTEFVNGLDMLMKKLGNINMNKPECMKPCNKMYEPLCVSNGKYRSVASNKCILDMLNCALSGKTFFKVIRKDAC